MHHASFRSSRGVTLIGLLFWAVVLAFGAIIALKVVPTVGEYYTIKQMVHKVAQDGGATVPEIRTAFDRAKQVETGVTLDSKDLDITKDAEGKVVINFAYDKEIEIYDPVFLVIKYAGSSAN